MILEDSQAASDYCLNYMPDCDFALPHGSQALGKQEVSKERGKKQIFVLFFHSLYDRVYGS